MPKEAIAAGAVDDVVPLPELAQRVLTGVGPMDRRAVRSL